MIVRELAAAWLQANCPRRDMQENFLQHLDQSLQGRLNCSFIIGRDLTVAGKPFLVECFGGEFFAFELTPAQAVPTQGGRLPVALLQEHSAARSRTETCGNSLARTHRSRPRRCRSTGRSGSPELYATAQVSSF